MITPMSDKQWSKIATTASADNRRCCRGCNASPCTPQCPIRHASALRRRGAVPIANTIIPQQQEKAQQRQRQPQNQHTVTQKEPRKAIPKKIRGVAWTNHFGNSNTGSCFCCKDPLNGFGDWHAGHIVSHANGGSDTAPNLRPVCGSCNKSMGTENMDDFKARCYTN